MSGDGEVDRQHERQQTRERSARMTLEAWSHASQVVMAGAIIVSLLFVWHELQENTKVALRNESNATMQQWSSFRQSIYQDAETADIFVRGMTEAKLADPVEQLRFDYLLREHGWATFQIWDRVNIGLLPDFQFEQGAGPDFLKVLCTPGGAGAWRRFRSEFPGPYAQDLERLALGFEKQHRTRCFSASAEAAS